MEWHRYTFFRKKDNTLVRARVVGKVEGFRTAWYIDIDDLSSTDALFFLREFRACLLNANHIMRLAYDLKEENDDRTVKIPYDYVKNIY